MLVVQWEQGKRKPTFSSATVMEWSELLANFLGKSLDPVPSIALFSMIEIPAVQSALQASKLLQGYLGEKAELPTWSYFSALCLVQRRLIVTFSG